MSDTTGIVFRWGVRLRLQLNTKVRWQDHEMEVGRVLASSAESRRSNSMPADKMTQYEGMGSGAAPRSILVHSPTADKTRSIRLYL